MSSEIHINTKNFQKATFCTIWEKTNSFTMRLEIESRRSLFFWGVFNHQIFEHWKAVLCFYSKSSLQIQSTSSFRQLKTLGYSLNVSQKIRRSPYCVHASSSKQNDNLSLCFPYLLNTGDLTKVPTLKRKENIF